MALNGYTFSVGSTKYSVKLSDKYESIKSLLGLTTITAQTTGSGNLESVKTHVKAMRMIPVSITYKQSSTSDKRRSETIAVPIDKIKDAGDLLGNNWGGTGKEITSVTFPMKASYS